MNFNKNMKTLLVIGGLSLVTLATAFSAQAQIIVRDNHVEDAIDDFKDNLLEQDREIDQNRTDFETDFTQKYYEDAVERLDKIIDALSHVDDPAETRDDEIFTNLDSQDEAREDILALSIGDGTKFGLAGLPEGGGNIDTYLQRYGYLKPDELYPDNAAQRNELIDEQKALYYADALIGEVDAARQARYDAYEQLAEKAKATEDVHKALDINNALLIENGRNLALLIHLQTAQLNNQSAQLRNNTRGRETVSNIFGLRGNGPT